MPPRECGRLLRAARNATTNFFQQGPCRPAVYGWTLGGTVSCGIPCSFALDAWPIAALTISLSLQALQAPATRQAKSLAASDAAAEAQANPVASLISVPLQNNTNLSLGSFNRKQDALNIQPVISADISQNWMVITRVVQPLIWQPYPNQNTGANTD